MDNHRAAGIDGITPAECKALPHALCHLQAVAIGVIEATSMWPHILTHVPLTCLGKEVDEPQPTDVRNIGITCLLYAAWSGIRGAQLASWASGWLPPQIIGARAQHSAAEAYMPMAIQIEHALLHRQHLTGALLDLSKALDRVSRAQLFGLMQHMGVPSFVTNALSAFYGCQTRYFRVGRSWSEPFSTLTGLLQGCALSTLALNMRTAVWVNMIEYYHPDASTTTFVDDRKIRTPVPGELSTIMQRTADYDQVVDDELNIKKLITFGTTATAKKRRRPPLSSL